MVIMNGNKRFIGCVTLGLLLALCSVMLVPLAIYRHIPKLSTYDDTELNNQRISSRFSRPFCLTSVYHNQQYTSALSGIPLWERLSEQWEVSPDSRQPDQSEATFSQKVLRGVTLNSNVHTFNRGSYATIEVSNHIIVQLPPRLCQPWPPL